VMNLPKPLRRGAGLVLAVALVVCAALSPARAATVKKADDTTVTGPLVALENGAVVLNLSTAGKSQRTPIALEDVVEITIDSAVDGRSSAKPAAPETKPAAPEKKELAYQKLIDAKTLKGWEGENEIWTVQDGVLTGTVTENTLSDKITYLIYTAASDFADFELHYRYKIVGGLRNSSGVQFRSQVVEVQGRKDVKGYQQDLGAQPGLTGGIVDNAANAGNQPVKAAPGERVVYTADGGRDVSSLDKNGDQLNALLKDNDWNDAALVVKGNHFVSVINGEVFCDVVNDNPAGAKAGVIAIQLSRRRAMTVQFKDMRIRKLGEQDAPEVPGLAWEQVKAGAEAARSTASAPASSGTATATTRKSAPPPPASAWQVRLVGGDQIVGQLVSWDAQQLKVKTPHGELAVPVKRVREVWHASPDDIAKARAAARTAGSSATEDVAFARKDDQVIPVAGLVLGVDGSALKFRFRDQERSILFDKLVGATLAASEDAAPDDSLQQTLLLGSGDVISGKWTALEDGAIAMTTPWGVAVKVPVRSVDRVRTKNGRLAFLSDLAPAQVEQVPYFDRLVPFRVDKSLTGGPIKLADGDHAKGISVHSRTVLRYDIGRRFERFRAKVGFQQPEGKAGRAVIRVLGDDKVLREIPDARGDQPPVDLDLSVAGVSRLSLEVDFGADQDVGDRVAWADARLLRAGLAR
jgi:hypothetical protein